MGGVVFSPNNHKVKSSILDTVPYIMERQPITSQFRLPIISLLHLINTLPNRFTHNTNFILTLSIQAFEKCIKVRSELKKVCKMIKFVNA